MPNKFKDAVSKLLKDTSGKPSSKRTITFIAFSLMCLAFLLNLAFEIPMEEFIYEGMLYVVAGGLGFSALEHLSPGKSGDTQNIDRSSTTKVGVGAVENPEMFEGQ